MNVFAQIDINSKVIRLLHESQMPLKDVTMQY